MGYVVLLVSDVATNQDACTYNTYVPTYVHVCMFCNTCICILSVCVWIRWSVLIQYV